MPKTIINRTWPALILIVLPCILLWPTFVGRVMLPAHLLADVMPWRAAHPGNLAPWNPLQFDGIAQFYPWRKFAAESLLKGYLPLWNPNEFCGTPFLANSQSAVLYPPNLLFVMIPVVYAFGFSALLHLIATGLFMYLYLHRAMGLTRGAAIAGAAAWQLSTWQVSWLALPSFLDTSTWFPLALWLTHRLSVRPTPRRAAVLGVCLGLMLLAGHLQIALYGLMLTAAYIAFLHFTNKAPFWRTVALGCTSLIIALGMAAPQMLSSIELSRVSHRSASHASVAGYRGYTSLAMPAYQLSTLYMPRLFGVPGDRGAPVARPNDPPGATPYHGETGYVGKTNFAENACYVGIVTLLLAIVGIIARWKTAKHIPFFAALALAALLIAVGSPLAGLLYFAIPGFSQTGSPARILVVWTLAVCVLAGWGCDAVLRRQSRHLWPSLVFVAAGIGLTVYTDITLSHYAGRTIDILSGASNDIRVTLALALAGIAIIAACELKRIRTSAAAAILIALVGVDLIGTGIGYNSATIPGKVYPRTPLISWLINHNRQDRVMPENRGWAISSAPTAILPPNSGTVYGLPEAQGYDSLQTGQFKSFLQDLDMGADPSPKANGNMDFAWGVPSKQSRFAALRYLVFPEEVPGLWRPAYTGVDGVVYIDSQALPRVNAVSGANPAFFDTAPTRIAIHAVDRSDITVADQWYPGWIARENGRTLPVLKGPFVFRTVPGVRPGILTLQYAPVSFRFGLYALCITLAALTAFVTTALTTRWRSAPECPSPSR